MIWSNLIIIIFIIVLIYFKRSWQPRIPLFFTTEKLLKIGHRGAPLKAHENTINSFKKAVESGVDGIELDVQFSSDRQLVVYHEWNCDDYSGQKKQIVNTSYSELSKIRLKNNNMNKIPLLSEVLNILPENCIKIIEIKSRHIFNTGIEKSILSVLEKYKLVDSSIISSFNPFVIRRIRNINHNIQTALLWTMEEPIFTFNSPLWVWWCKPDGFHADINCLDKDLVKWVRRKKMSLLAFTILNPDQFAKASDLGLDGIFLDDPHLNYLL